MYGLRRLIQMIRPIELIQYLLRACMHDADLPNTNKCHIGVASVH